MVALAQRMEAVEAGEHLCVVYDHPSEQMPALVPFLREGLRTGERCVYVADDQTTDEVAAALEAGGICVAEAVESGALLLWSREEWRQPGALSSFAKRAQVQSIIDASLQHGFKGVRFAVEMTWTLGPDIEIDQLRHWEATINEIFTPETQGRIVCQYSRRRLAPAVIRAALATHPVAVVGAQVVTNPYYEAPLILKPEAEGDQVDWMISMLRRAGESAESSEQPTPPLDADFFKEAERIAELLRESEEDLRDFFMNGTVGLHWVGPDGRVLRVNQAELKMLGYTEEEYVGRQVAEFHVSREAIDDILQRLAAGETLHDYECELRCKDGSTKHVLIDSNVLWRNGEFVHTRCFTRDISERKVAAEISSRLSAIIDSSDDAIVSKDLDGIINSWNAGAERLFGYTAEEAIGRSVRMLIPQDRQHEEDEVLRTLTSGQRVDHYETVRQRKDGTLVDVSLTVSPIRDGADRLVGAAKIARDISIRKRAEESVARSLQLREEFLSLISHELRTPIAIIVGNADILLRHLKNLTADQTQQALEDLASQAERLQEIIENLLLLSKMDQPEPVLVEPVQVKRLVENSVAAFNRRVPARPVLVSVEGTGSLALGEPALLAMVLDNLIANANKYSPAGEPIEVRIADPEDGAVEVRVLDRGIGLDPDDLDAIFTPFYRSPAARAQAGGMGLGLAVCQRAMIGQGGTIAARRRDDGGSEFIIRLLEAIEA